MGLGLKIPTGSLSLSWTFSQREQTPLVGVLGLQASPPPPTPEPSPGYMGGKQKTHRIDHSFDLQVLRFLTSPPAFLQVSEFFYYCPLNNCQGI